MGYDYLQRYNFFLIEISIFCKQKKVTFAKIDFWVMQNNK